MKNIARISAFILASTLAVMPVAQGENAVVESKPFLVNFTGKETFAKLVKDGKYTRVDEELIGINPKLPKIKKGNKIFVLVDFSETIPVEDVVSQLKARGLRPATVIELLAFGAQNPNEQLLVGHPVLSPDAMLEFVDTYDGEKTIDKYYVYIRNISDEHILNRLLSANYVGMFWNKNWRCLAVRLALEECKTGASSGIKSSNQERR